MAVNRKVINKADLMGLPPSPETKSGVPKYELEALARAFLPDIIAFYESEEGQRKFREWKQEEERDKAGKQ
ncbi:MAG: hypothetical protein IJH07_04115 [Ruminococcus sp.]|nr:hypothetical protein [Ruminococcus sp.]